MGEYEYRLRDMDGYCEEPNGGFDWWQLILVVMIALMLIGLFTGCKTKTQIVSVPEYHTEYIVRSDTVARLDSVLIRDSVYVYHNGDTVVVNKVAYRDRLRNVYKVRIDTILRRDSVLVPYPVEKEVSKMEKVYMATGKYALSALLWVAVVAVLWLIAWICRRLRRE